MTWCSKAQGNYTSDDSDVKGSHIAHNCNGSLVFGVFGYRLTTKTHPPCGSRSYTRNPYYWIARSNLPLQLGSCSFAMVPGWITVILGIGELGGGKLVHQIAANIVAIPWIFTLCTQVCEIG